VLTFDRALLAAYLRPEWRRATILGGVLLAGIGLQLAGPQIVGAFINDAESHGPLSELLWLAVAFLAAAVLSQLATVTETFLAEDLGWRTTNALRADLTRHVLNLDAAFHGEHGPGELIERIDGDVAAIAGFFSRFVVQVLGSGLFLIGVLVLLFIADWRVGAALAAFALMALIFMARGGGFVSVQARRSREAAADLSAFLEEHLTAMADIKTSGADGYAMQRLQERLAERFHRTWASGQAGSLFNGAVGVIFALGTGAALSLSVALHESGALTVGAIYVVFRYTAMLRVPLEQLTHQMNSLQQATGGIVRVRELLERKPAIVSSGDRPLPGGAVSLDLDQVSFAYHQEPVLRDVSFRLEAGQVLGLLGRTGSGKTTISRLVFRMHDPTHGAIRLAGVDLREVAVDSIGTRIGLVTQDVQLFPGSLRDNVTLFDDGVPDGRLREAFQALGLGEWLDGLPDGLETMLGQGGRGVSAGEAQLIAMARVFLKDPGLVVLDEASSRLDPVTQHRLESGAAHLLAGRTGIIIAHRLETVERADVIGILDAGRLVEFSERLRLLEDPDSRFSRLLRAGMAEALQ
jgi:ATP-binding cassette, subfamily B, bacterial